MDREKPQLLLQLLGQVFETCTSRIRSRNASLSKRSLVPRIPLVTVCQPMGWYLNVEAKLKKETCLAWQGLFENLALSKYKNFSITKRY